MPRSTVTIASTVAAAMIAALSLAGCSADSGDLSAAGSVTAAAQGTASDAISGVSAGSYTGTFDGKQVTLKAAYLIDGKDVTVDSGTYASVASDQAVFLVVNGGSLTISGATISKSGDASASSAQNPGDVADDYNFYGTNSAIVVAGAQSRVTVSGTQITTTSSGSNAIVATSSGKADVSDVTITTSGNSSRGLHATYGGAINGTGLTITTSGAHSAALATDRGSGTVTVTGSTPEANTLNTSGDGSPLIYSTGTIKAAGVNGTSAGSQAVVVEGRNRVTLAGSQVTAKGSDAVMMYQSFSGDAADKDATAQRSALELDGTTITYTGQGPLLYFTNTEAQVTLDNSAFDSSSASAFAKAGEDRWGTSGSNGAKASITAIRSRLTGPVTAGSSSSIAISLTESSQLTGTTSGSVTVGTDEGSAHEN